MLAIARARPGSALDANGDRATRRDTNKYRLGGSKAASNAKAATTAAATTATVAATMPSPSPDVEETTAKSADILQVGSTTTTTTTTTTLSTTAALTPAYPASADSAEVEINAVDLFGFDPHPKYEVFNIEICDICLNTFAKSEIASHAASCSASNWLVTTTFSQALWGIVGIHSHTYTHPAGDVVLVFSTRQHVSSLACLCGHRCVTRRDGSAHN
jgi:hypothetical protein